MVLFCCAFMLRDDHILKMPFELIHGFLTSFSFLRESDTTQAPHLHSHHFYFSILSCWKLFLSLYAALSIL